MAYEKMSMPLFHLYCNVVSEYWPNILVVLSLSYSRTTTNFRLTMHKRKKAGILVLLHKLIE